MLPVASLAVVPNKASCDSIAIVGCGVLGTSLCKQLLSCPDFQSKSGRFIVSQNLLLSIMMCAQMQILAHSLTHSHLLNLVTAITKTSNNHASILNAVGEHQNFNIVTLDNIPKEEKYANVIFCAPPSGFEDYPGAIKDAADNLWAGPDQGRFVFTSSGGM